MCFTSSSSSRAAPNEADPGTHRLTLSRHGTWPSDKEIEIVLAHLKEALRKNGRVAESFQVEPYLKANKDIHYHVLFWREMVQASLL